MLEKLYFVGGRRAIGIQQKNWFTWMHNIGSCLSPYVHVSLKSGGPLKPES